MPEIAYQNEAQIEQLLAFREVSSAYGQTDNVAHADKQLAALGIKSKADRLAAARKRAAAAEDVLAQAEAEEGAEDEAAPAEAPKGRRAAKKATAAGE